MLILTYTQTPLLLPENRKPAGKVIRAAAVRAGRVTHASSQNISGLVCLAPHSGSLSYLLLSIEANYIQFFVSEIPINIITNIYLFSMG